MIGNEHIVVFHTDGSRRPLFFFIIDEAHYGSLTVDVYEVTSWTVDGKIETSLPYIKVRMSSEGNTHIDQIGPIQLGGLRELKVHCDMMIHLWVAMTRIITARQNKISEGAKK